MKKYIKIILCIALVFCLVSCDLSAIWNNLKGTTEATTTTTTTPPVYETVTLSELIDKEKLSYITITYQVFEYGSSFISSFKYTIDNNEDILEFLDILNFEVEEYINDKEYGDLFRLRLDEARKNNWKLEETNPMAQYYFIILIYYEDYSGAAILTIYPNNQIDIYDANSNKHYYNLENQDNCWEEIMNKYVVSNQGGN
jgi:hypothetical protein